MGLVEVFYRRLRIQAAGIASSSREGGYSENQIAEVASSDPKCSQSLVGICKCT